MMASESYGKIKTRRNRNSKPYNRAESFIGKLKSVLPQWISRVIPWEQSKTNDEDSTNVNENEFKRPAPLPSTSSTSHVISFVPLQPMPSTSRLENTSSIIPGLSSNLYQPGSSNDNGFNSTEVRLEDVDDEESVSTSGCSSMVPHFDRQSEYQQEVLPIDEAALEQFRERNDVHDQSRKFTPSYNLKDADGSDKTQPRKKQRLEPETTLFSLDNSAKVESEGSNTSALWNSEIKHCNSSDLSKQTNLRRPSFNISAFGSPLFQANKSRGSILSDSVNESIYYPGKTSFGGASSQRRLNSMAPYQTNTAARLQIRVKSKVNEDLGLVSSTAKRILHTLESMSTPLSDAQKIPPNAEASSSSILSFKPSNVRRRATRTPVSQRRANLRNAPPTTRIVTPEISSAKAVNLANASQYYISMSEFQGDSNNKDGCADSNTTIEPHLKNNVDHESGGGKMKTRNRSSFHYSAKSSRNSEPDEMPEPSFPDISIDMKSFPKIDFGTSLSTQNHSTPMQSIKKSTQTLSSATTSIPSITSSVTSTNLLFTFASPLIKEAPNQPVNAANVQTSFSFTSPKMATFDADGTSNSFTIKSSTASPLSENKTFASHASQSTNADKGSATPSFNFKVPEPVALKKKTPAKPELEDKPAQLKTGSISDYLKEISNETDEISTASQVAFRSTEKTTSGFGSQYAPPAGNWECDSCMVSNKAENSVCVACQSAKPSATKSSGFGSQFAPAAGNWECDSCMVSNKASNSVCVACQSAKPSSTKSGGFGSKFAPAVGNWECGTCLVSNKADDSSCIACKSAKPSSLKSSGFGSAFAPVAGSWECTSCMLSNKSTNSKCIACESPKPACVSQPSKSTFIYDDKFKPSNNTWECTGCLVRNKISADKCTCCDAAKPSAGSKTLSAIAFGQTANTWECSTCMVRNSADKSACVACQTTRDGESGAKLPAIPATTTWECDTCLIRNKAIVSKCIACESPRSTKASSQGSFTFGAPSASFLTANKTSAASETFSKFNSGVSSSFSMPTSEGFKFKPTDTSSSKSEGFSFATSSGKSSDDIKPLESSSSGFKFVPSTSPFVTKSDNKSLVSGASDKLQVAPNKDGSVKAAESTVNKGFVFGAGNADAPKAVTKDGGKDLKGGFMFGSAGNAGKSPAGGFTFGGTPVLSSGTPVAEVKLSFESANDSGVSAAGSAQSSLKTSETTGGFSFVSSSATPSTTSPPSSNFSFGTMASTTASPASFSFGVTPSSSASVATKPTTSSSGFTFGGSASSSATEKPLPSSTGSTFGAAVSVAEKPLTSSGGFTFGAATASSAQTKPTVATGGFTFGAAETTTLSGPSFVTPTATGFPASTNKSSAPSNFTFGSATSSANSSTPGMFAFGTSAASKAQASSNFTFGASSTPKTGTNAEFSFMGRSSTTSTPSTSTGSSFSFGANTNTVNSTNTVSSSNSGIFTFAASSASNPLFKSQGEIKQPSSITPFGGAATPSFGAVTTSTPAGFSFGAPSTTAANIAAPTSSIFSFGAQPANSSKESAAAAVPSFSFGSQAPEQPSAFGASTSQPPVFGQQSTGFGTTPAPNFSAATPDSGSVFRFGENQASQPAQSSMFGAPAPVTAAAPATGPPAGFNFNPAAVTPNTNFAAAPAAGQPFQFMSGAADNPFNPPNPTNQQPAAGAAASHGYRKFKRAQRRIKK